MSVVGLGEVMVVTAPCEQHQKLDCANASLQHAHIWKVDQCSSKACHVYVRAVLAQKLFYDFGILFRRCILLLCNTHLWLPEGRPC